MSEERQNRQKSYKYCFVPNCRNTTTSTPNKTFICVPKKEEIRKLWCIASGYNGKLRLSSAICEDHFKLDEDLDNYMEWKMTKCRKRLKEGVYPRFFSCQAPSEFASAFVLPCNAPGSSAIEGVNITEEDPLSIDERIQRQEDRGPFFKLVEPFDFIGIKSESLDLGEEVDDDGMR
ncbi:uncharacterized protein [Fopius arisanus]|uniref:THAP-type domain-containing protein n=2 Tax=Fopius arisanus TaxID=64838 RepID=A0A0C9R301_9HYME|nr:PREDICTED: uncharacterized protein LOC105263349 [Fopius arisanus]